MRRDCREGRLGVGFAVGAGLELISGGAELWLVPAVTNYSAAAAPAKQLDPHIASVLEQSPVDFLEVFPGFGELTLRVHEAGCSVADGMDRGRITYGRTWHLDRIEDQSDLAWIIIHVFKPKVVHLGTPCTKQCLAGLREFDEATKAMNDLTKKI